MKQREIFIESEGNAWYRRNRQALAARRLPDDDPLLLEVLDLLPAIPGRPRLLEVGCGDGGRLAWLQHHRDVECHGIDPSAEAVAQARTAGVEAQVGTADALPYGDADFDIVIFGFCLYLCDRDDLFQIAGEGDRVLRAPGWLLILDFFSPDPISRPYSHRAGVRSFKMDYRTLFTWHPHYQCLTHRVRGHAGEPYVDDPDEWVAVSTLRKWAPPRT